MAKKSRSDRIAATVFFLSYSALLGGGALAYGVVANMRNWFPVPQMDAVREQVKELLPGTDDFLILDTVRHETTVETLGEVAPGLVMVSGDYEPRKTAVRVMTRDGEIVHEWRIPWGDVWPAGDGEFPQGRRPASDMYLHGIDILPDGSIVANFEHLSTFRMDICGEIVWKLDNLGHHSVHYDAGSDTIWVSAEDYFASGRTDFDYHVAPLRSWTLQELDLKGNILRDIPVIDILLQNERDGLLYLSFLDNVGVRVSGDTLHLNDVETFPADMEEGFFTRDDVVISLRNISTVMVIDRNTLEAKLVSVGEVLRQHDPDFISGDVISIFDNRFPHPRGRPRASHIVEWDGPSGEMTRVLSGDGEYPFFTAVMGSHERLPNGNIILTEADGGRVLEYSADGDLVWRFSNRWAENAARNLRVYNVDVLGPEMDAAFFEERTAQCG